MVFENFNDARNHHKLPYVKLLNELTLHGFDVDHSPFLQIQINFFNYEKKLKNSQFIEATYETTDFKKRRVCDLYLIILENKNSIDLEIEFDTEVFMEQTVNRYLQTVIEILHIFGKSKFNFSKTVQEIESEIKAKFCDDKSNIKKH